MSVIEIEGRKQAWKWVQRAPFGIPEGLIKNRSERNPELIKSHGCFTFLHRKNYQPPKL